MTYLAYRSPRSRSTARGAQTGLTRSIDTLSISTICLLSVNVTILAGVPDSTPDLRDNLFPPLSPVNIDVSESGKLKISSFSEAMRETIDSGDCGLTSSQQAIKVDADPRGSPAGHSPVCHA